MKSFLQPPSNQTINIPAWSKNEIKGKTIFALATAKLSDEYFHLQMSMLLIVLAATFSVSMAGYRKIQIKTAIFF